MYTCDLLFLMTTIDVMLFLQVFQKFQRGTPQTSDVGNQNQGHQLNILDLQLTKKNTVLFNQNVIGLLYCTVWQMVKLRQLVYSMY